MNDSNLHLALFLFEKLYTNGPLPIKAVYDILKFKNYNLFVITDELCIKNTVVDFVCCYPSLFETDNIFVYPLYSGTCKSEPISQINSVSNTNRNLDYRRHSMGQENFIIESEIVDYILKNIKKFNDKWISISDLSEHLNHTNDKLRHMVNNSALLTAFLKRNSHIFDVQGKLVGLKLIENHSNSDSSEKNCQHSIRVNERVSTKVKAQTPTRNTLSAKESYKSKPQNTDKFSLALSTKDYETIILIKEVIQDIKNIGEKCDIITLKNGIFTKFGTKLSGIIGLTNIELEEYISKNSLFFSINEDRTISIKDNSDINVVITDGLDRTKINSDRTLSLVNCKGMIYHVARLWGIIDLGHHEHVFFDKSIFKNIEDLQKYFQIGELVYFNAILATKDSRAKWRATRVWKETDCQLLKKTLSEADCVSINKPRDKSSIGSPIDIVNGTDADVMLHNLIMLNNITLNNPLLDDSLHSEDDLDDDDEELNTMKSILSIDLEESLMSHITSEGGPMQIKSQGSNRSTKSNETGTQTLATGDIIAIQFYQDK